jgi:four helix bundle protein
MRSFRELRVWEESHQIVLEVYRLTASFPADERFALTSQLRRAAYSVPFNIVEGTARRDNECRQFLRISLGSAAELEYGLLLAKDLGYVGLNEYESLTLGLLGVKRMLNAFIARLEPGGKLAEAPRQRPTANGQRPATKGPEAS